jgi:hypothetical protein
MKTVTPPGATVCRARAAMGDVAAIRWSTDFITEVVSMGLDHNDEDGATEDPLTEWGTRRHPE